MNIITAITPLIAGLVINLAGMKSAATDTSQTTSTETKTTDFRGAVGSTVTGSDNIITTTTLTDPDIRVETVGITTTTFTDDVVSKREVIGEKTGTTYTYTTKSDHTELSIADKVTYLEEEVSEDAVTKVVLGTTTSAIQVSGDTQKAITILTDKMNILAGSGIVLGNQK